MSPAGGGVGRTVGESRKALDKGKHEMSLGKKSQSASQRPGNKELTHDVITWERKEPGLTGPAAASKDKDTLARG